MHSDDVIFENSLQTKKLLQHELLKSLKTSISSVDDDILFYEMEVSKGHGMLEVLLKLQSSTEKRKKLNEMYSYYQNITC